MNILVLNAGSSTLKCAIFNIDNHSRAPQDPLWRGTLDWGKGREDATFFAENNSGAQKQFSLPYNNLQDAVEKLLATAWEGDTKVFDGPKDVGAVGHRVVHGGQLYTKPIRITEKVKNAIRELAVLAPLHNPTNIEGIEIAEKILPGIPQVAVFDTAYHSTIGEVAATYPVPISWRKKGIRRYGFHGISHRYCAERVVQLLPEEVNSPKIITCHLGNGCSLAATAEGRCVDTTMGFTPMEGLMMGTRCGSIDPGILLHLLRAQNLSVDELDHILNFESGLQGICGSADMRLILERIKKKDSSAAFALSIFVYRLKAFIASMAASMNGLDVLVFTAGIGEYAQPVREETCRGLSYLGVELDNLKNLQCTADERISTENSSVKVYVIHTREEWAIAQETYTEGMSGIGRAWSYIRSIWYKSKL